MKIVSIPTVEEDVRQILSAPPIERKNKQYALVRQCGVTPKGTTPFLDYMNHLQQINHMEVSTEIQPELYQAIEQNPQAKQFLMAIS